MKWEIPRLERLSESSKADGVDTACHPCQGGSINPAGSCGGGQAAVGGCDAGTAAVGGCVGGTIPY